MQVPPSAWGHTGTLSSGSWPLPPHLTLGPRVSACPPSLSPGPSTEQGLANIYQVTSGVHGLEKSRSCLYSAFDCIRSFLHTNLFPNLLCLCKYSEFPEFPKYIPSGSGWELVKGINTELKMSCRGTTGG